MIGKIARIGLLALVATMSAAAFAFFDTQILIERALNSPTLTVRYNGARAAMAEMRLNGISLGTRTLNSAKANGEMNFTLDLNALNDGDNEVEVRLFDKAGKILGSQKIAITSDDGSNAPVRMTNPKVGATVQGAVEIKIGFGREMRNAYVSFFVDNQFKSMTNAAPYTFVWDTTRDANGWHELEAMVVDETSATFRTRKVRVLVNNFGGRTDRQGLPVPATTPAAPAAIPPAPVSTGSAKGAAIATTASAAVSSAVTPSLSGMAVSNVVSAKPGEKAGVKPGAALPTQTTGPRVLTPGTASGAGVQAASPSVRQGTISVRPAAAATSAAVGSAPKLRIVKGQRLSDISALTIILNSKIVHFDVQPRVLDGIAIAPVRHLLEGAGGEVRWQHAEKIVDAIAEGRPIRLRIGDRFAKVGEEMIELELIPFLESGRTIVPISFLRDALSVEIEYDSRTGHVLITSIKKP